MLKKLFFGVWSCHLAELELVVLMSYYCAVATDERVAIKAVDYEGLLVSDTLLSGRLLCCNDFSSTLLKIL